MAYDRFVMIATLNLKAPQGDWLTRCFFGTLQRGLISRVPIKVATATAAGARASQEPAAASAAVAAQVIDEMASANVAMRDEICRRRNWLRLACVRNQSWIRVADADATVMPMADTRA
jgi:hypothetical protein